MDGLGRLLSFIWRSSRRVAVFVVGVVVVAAGFVMLVTPGPGLAAIVAGLAILATEFAWAEYLLDKAKRQAAKAARKAKEKTLGRRSRKAKLADPVELGKAPSGPADAESSDRLRRTGT